MIQSNPVIGPLILAKGGIFECDFINQSAQNIPLYHDLFIGHGNSLKLYSSSYNEKEMLKRASLVQKVY